MPLFSKSINIKLKLLLFEKDFQKLKRIKIIKFVNCTPKID
jgi:hypothetical protein